PCLSRAWCQPPPPCQPPPACSLPRPPCQPPPLCPPPPPACQPPPPCPPPPPPCQPPPPCPPPSPCSASAGAVPAIASTAIAAMNSFDAAIICNYPCREPIERARANYCSPIVSRTRLMRVNPKSVKRA